MPDATDHRLAQQYEAYPYPQRDPRDEAGRLLLGSPSHLREIDHWVFGARRPRSRPLRVLVAGGGTGDAAIMLAAQMRRLGQPGHVTYLDRSDAARRVAQARAVARGLDNISFHAGSLLDLDGAGLGVFDYIDCCGVLHHLPDPAAGLAALLSVLAPEGGMGLMVYAPHGRTGVTMIQDALRLLAPEHQPLAQRLDAARRLLRQLPETAWLRQNRSVTDHLVGGDAGLADLLLNPRDQSFTIIRLLGLLAARGLVATCLLEPMRYDPATYLADPRLRAAAALLAPLPRAQLAEDLSGAMSTHVVYCRRADDAGLAPDGLAGEAVPVAREVPGEALARQIRADGVLEVSFEGVAHPVPLPALAGPLLRLVDGQRNLAAIAAEMAARGTPHPAFDRAWAELWARLSAGNRLLLAPPP